MRKLKATPPRHIAIIMDGNGRWATARALPRAAGHAAGAENFRTIATFCKEIGIEYLTVYAFSTENFSRPPEEVNGIINLLSKYLDESLEKMVKDRVKMRFLGDISVLPADILGKIRKTEELSKTFEGVTVNICFNYGGRKEIIRAAEALRGSDKPVDEKTFADNLYTAGLPDPDIVIRPGAETRLSNFLLWQSAYSEFFFTKTMWPDFSKKELIKIIEEFSSRKRRYGGV